MPTPIEDKFIACVRGSTAPVGLGTTLVLRMDLAYAFEGARLVERDGYHCCVTPRGADLLATADAIGYDPQAPAPEPAPKTCPCPDCKGEGRVPVSRSSNRTISELVHEEPATIVELPGWDMTCGTCEGKKVVPLSRLGYNVVIRNVLAACDEHRRKRKLSTEQFAQGYAVSCCDFMRTSKARRLVYTRAGCRG